MQTSEASFCTDVTSGTGEDISHLDSHLAPTWRTIPPSRTLKLEVFSMDSSLLAMSFPVLRSRWPRLWCRWGSQFTVLCNSFKHVFLDWLDIQHKILPSSICTPRTMTQKYTGCCTASCPCWWLCIWIPVSFKVSVWPVLSHGSTGSTRHREQTVTSPLPQALGHPFFSGVTIFKQPFVVDWLMGRRVDSLLLQALLHFLRVQFQTCAVFCHPVCSSKLKGTGLAILCTCRGCILPGYYKWQVTKRTCS